jgi:chaperone required for assembly of F1-ATPase
VRRFYKDVVLGDDFSVLLDGKPLQTPARATLVLPTRALAEAVAAEWRGQGDKIEPTAMLLTKLANTAIDRAGALRGEIEAELLGFGGSDLICYFAAWPEALVARQQAAWLPLHDWLHQAHGVRLKTTAGVSHVAQDPAALAALARLLAAQDRWTLTGLQTATALTGSLVLALALAEGRLAPADAFALARLDETFQAEQWGADAAAEKRSAGHARELEMTGEFMALART